METNLITLEVFGSAMEPVLLEGDEITVDSNLDPRTNGKDLAVVEFNGNYHICKLVKYGRQLLILQDNGPIIPIREEQVTIIGKVVAINENNHSAANTMAIS